MLDAVFLLPEIGELILAVRSSPVFLLFQSIDVSLKLIQSQVVAFIPVIIQKQAELNLVRFLFRDFERETCAVPQEESPL